MGFFGYRLDYFDVTNLKFFNTFKKLVFSILIHGYDERFSKIIVLNQGTKHIVLKGNRVVAALKLLYKNQIFKKLIKNMIIDTKVKNEIFKFLNEIDVHTKKYHFSFKNIENINVLSCLKTEEIILLLKENIEQKTDCVLNLNYGKKILDIYNILTTNKIITYEQLLENKQVQDNIFHLLGIKEDQIWTLYLDFIFIENILKIHYENQDDILEILINKNVEVLSIKNAKKILNKLITKSNFEANLEQIFNVEYDLIQNKLVNNCELEIEIENIYNLLFKLFKANEQISPISDNFIKKFAHYLGPRHNKNSNWINIGQQKLKKCEELNYDFEIREKFLQKFESFFDWSISEVEIQCQFKHIWSFSLIMEQLKISSEHTYFLIH
ncbi:hypothetical protein [Mesomycoplasma hyorhinis]|uniref:hypothetical protein n=2 Tax=Mesomycoplasma hyorhinis TaxID=2100 RepID=UPI001C048968|nr:hypothetical protein [Mesomycoplasma hyorhinis]